MKFLIFSFLLVVALSAAPIEKKEEATVVTETKDATLTAEQAKPEEKPSKIYMNVVDIRCLEEEPKKEESKDEPESEESDDGIVDFRPYC